jgi:hypothetical protein
MQISLQACGVADADRIRPLLRGSSPSHLGLEVFGAAANISSVLAIVRRNRSCGRGRLERSDVGPCCGQAAGRGLLKRPRTVTFQFRTKAPVPQGVSYSNQLSSGLPLCQARSRLWTHHSMIRYFPGAVQLHQGRFFAIYLAGPWPLPAELQVFRGEPTHLRQSTSVCARPRSADFRTGSGSTV